MTKQELRATFVCDYEGCGKVFNRRDYLERHAVNHSQVKPYSCEICSRDFSRKDLYDNHMVTKFHLKRIQELEKGGGRSLSEGSADVDLSSSGHESTPTLDSPAGFSLRAGHGREGGTGSSESFFITQVLPRSSAGVSMTSGQGFGAQETGLSDDLNEISLSGSRATAGGGGTDAFDQPRPLFPGSGTRFESQISNRGILFPPPGSKGTDNEIWDYYRPPKRRNGSIPGSGSVSASGSGSGNRSARGSVDGSVAGSLLGGSGSGGGSSSGSSGSGSRGSGGASGNTGDFSGLLAGSVTNNAINGHGGIHFRGSSSARTTAAAVSAAVTSAGLGNGSTLGSRSNSVDGSVGPSSTDASGSSGDIDFDARSVTDVAEASSIDSHLSSIEDSVLKGGARASAMDEMRQPAARSPGNLGESDEFTEHYRWFFDDAYGTLSEKYGYDKVYRESTETYDSRARQYRSQQSPQKGTYDIDAAEFGEAYEPFEPFSESTAQLVLSVLQDVPEDFFTDKLRSMESFVEVAWRRAIGVAYLLHRPTFDPNNSHPALLAVLVMLGLALSDLDDAKELARAVYPSVSLYTYESLNQPEGSIGTRYLAPFVGHLQAFGLLIRHETLILGDETHKLSLTSSYAGRRITDKFLWMALTSVPHLGLVKGTSWKALQSSRRPVWATISREGYNFHQGVERELQWREWAVYEMCKRTVHFAFYSDNVNKLSELGVPFEQLSLFQLDIHMISSQAVWSAASEDEFFFIVGPTLVLNNVPFLGLIKSLVRFPRVMSTGPAQKHGPAVPRSSSSLLATRMIAFGLMNLVGELSGIFSNGRLALDMVLSPSLTRSPRSLQASHQFDRGTQARLYRGLDIWFGYFEDAYGNVTERLFNASESLGLKIMPEFSELSTELGAGTVANQSTGIPQYALVIVLYHYSSFITLHEDLSIVLQVTTNLAKWLSRDEKRVTSQRALLEFLYMPLYAQWIQTDEAKAMVSTSSLYLVWTLAATGKISSKTLNPRLLSAVSYIATIVVWLYDLTVTYNNTGGGEEYSAAAPVDLDNFGFVEEALEYLGNLCQRLDRGLVSGGPQTGFGVPNGPRPSVRSVILLSACLLHVRQDMQPLVTLLVQLLCVIEPQMSVERVQTVLDRAEDYFAERSQQTPPPGSEDVPMPPAPENADGSEPVNGVGKEGTDSLVNGLESRMASFVHNGVADGVSSAASNGHANGHASRLTEGF